MPFLRVEKGSCPGQILELTGDRIVIGRHPSCQVVLDDAAVSRQHAQISESHGSYFLKDLRSRNRTYLNAVPVEGSVPLRDRDTIRLCDVLFRFLVTLQAGDVTHLDDARPIALIPGPSITVRPTAKPVEEDGKSRGKPSTKSTQVPPEPRPLSQQEKTSPEFAIEPDEELDQNADNDNNGSAILGRVILGESSDLLLSVHPEQKLRAVLEISRILSHSLQMSDLLDRVIEGLFKIFPQADHGVVLLMDSKRPRLRIESEKFRRSGENPPGVSMTVVRQALKDNEALLSADVVNDDRFANSESIPSLSLRSVICVPLHTATGERFGVVQLSCGDVGRAFRREDLETLVSLAGPVSLAVENARLHEELVAQRDMRKDLDFAMQVQLGFLPSQPPRVPGYEFFDHYEAAFRVGGDYFDYVEFPDGRVAVAVGDVAGKGVPAALLMARLFSSARYQLLARGGVADALAALNEEISQSALGHRFITCAFVLLDPQSHQVIVANAGHMAPLVRSIDGKVTVLGQAESGLPIGLAPEQTFQEVKLNLQPGDVLLLYTDGVTEAMDDANDLYGRKRLMRLMSSGPAPIRDLIETVVGDVNRFMGQNHQRDDICLVGFRRLDTPPA